MLKPQHKTLSMHALGRLVHVKKLLRTRLISDPRFLLSNPAERCVPSHRLISSADRSWEEESRLFRDTINKTPSARSNNLREDSSEGDDHPRVRTFYDPLTGEVSTENAEVGSPPAEEEESRVSSTSVDSISKSPPARSNNLSEGDEQPLSEKLSRPRLSKCSEALNEGEEKIRVSSIMKKKAGKVKISWICESCGATPGQWWGICHTCGAPGTVKQFSESEINRARGVEVTEAAMRSWLPEKLGSQVPKSLTEVNKGRNQYEWRIPLSGLFGMEVSRVLGGGLVPGSLVLIGGDPGVGKSTLLLQIAAIIAEGNGLKGPAPVIYVSGEESIEQIGNRADRMRITTPNLFLYSSTDIEDILDKIQTFSPQALIVDSIQTVYLRGVSGSAGNINQVKECTSALLRFAKQTNIPVLLIGHVTKTGDIAGPRMLEHIVDAVLYMEGERYSSYRLLRSVKNRFGSTDELGVFEMSEAGLQAVSNPSEMFISDHYSDSEILAGLAVSVIVDGSRAFVIEIQALCVSNSSGKRHVNGVKESRSDMIISVLMKQAGLKLQDITIFLNVVSGFILTETAGDLAIAAAICSSFLEFPIPNDVAFIGEVGLGGELRAVPRMDKRVSAIAKLGYKKCVVPTATEKTLRSLNPDIEILSCRTLKEVINTIFSCS